MFKSIKNILIPILFFALAIILISSFIRHSLNKVVISLESKNSSVEILDNGIIEVKDTVKINIQKNSNKSLEIPLTIFPIGNENELSSQAKPEIIDIAIDGESILYQYDFYYFKEDVRYKYDNMYINIINAHLLKPGNHLITINYKYNSIDVMQQFNNYTVFRIHNNNFNTLNVNVNLPSATKVFELSNKKGIVNNISQNMYSLDMSKVKSKSNKDYYTEVLIDNGILNNVQKVNSNYKINNIESGFLDIEDFKYIIILSIVEFILIILVLILKKKPKVDKEYVRDTNSVIEPIIAEAIIDKKIGGKELIMSCIVNLIHKGNLKNIGNDKLELISTDNLSDYEKEIVNLIFNENKLIEFKQIKNIFISDNNKTKEFFNKFKLIKNKIENKIYDNDIYSKTGKCFLTVLKAIILVMYINIICIAGLILKDNSFVIADLIKLNIIGFIISFLLVYFRKSEIYRKLDTPIGLLLFLFLLGDRFAPLIELALTGKINILICLAVLLIVNTIVLKMSNTHIFTSKGKIEYKKAMGLKQYIKDYSLMKEKDVESTVIWDKYLAYAVAFGIPNKIMNKFNEGLMNTNIALQEIDKTLKF